MLEIRMKTISAGPDGVRHPGKTYLVPKGEAAALVKGCFAETATIKAPERAVVSSSETAIDGPEETTDGLKVKNRKRNQ